MEDRLDAGLFCAPLNRIAIANAEHSVFGIMLQKLNIFYIFSYLAFFSPKFWRKSNIFDSPCELSKL
jgi:hypothetical protein